jgi:hypothetical protein
MVWSVALRRWSVGAVLVLVLSFRFCFCKIDFITHIFVHIIHIHKQRRRRLGSSFSSQLKQLMFLQKWFNLPIKVMFRHTNLNTFAGNDGGGWDGGEGSVLFGQVDFFYMHAV